MQSYKVIKCCTKYFLSRFKITSSTSRPKFISFHKYYLVFLNPILDLKLKYAYNYHALQQSHAIYQAGPTSSLQCQVLQPLNKKIIKKKKIYLEISDCANCIAQWFFITRECNGFNAHHKFITSGEGISHLYPLTQVTVLIRHESCKYLRVFAVTFCGLWSLIIVHTHNWKQEWQKGQQEKENWRWKY